MSEYETSWKREKSVLNILEVSQATLYRWRVKGTIQSRKVEGVRFYNLGEFLKRLEEGDME